MENRERATPDEPGALLSPIGTEITGTYERITGRADIISDSFRLAGVGDDLRLEFEHDGHTEVFWDGQETVSKGGQTVFLDDEGNEWLEAELIAALIGKPAPIKTAGDYSEHELERRELATVLAALRCYQASDDGHGNADLHEIATNGGKVEALTHAEIDALCERLNIAP